MTIMPTASSCPICARPVAMERDLRPPTFPFCSARCRDRDFGAWISGSYAVAGEVPGVDSEPGRGRALDRDQP
jgi:hypothetical protein